VDVAEIKKLDAYLKQQFGNSRIRVVPKSADAADVFLGEERIGNLVVDDEDGERSYNFEMKLVLGEPVSVKSLKALEATLRRRFDNENIRVVARPRKTDSVEVLVGQDYIGVLFFDEKETRSAFFEMPILDFDLEETRTA
jgi:Protein of unknown function (DUF3126)